MSSEQRQLQPAEGGHSPRSAIGDTGPLLHLHEIGRTYALGVFSQITLPD